MFVSEIKRVGNAVFLEVLVMEGEIGFLATMIKISHVETSFLGKMQRTSKGCDLSKQRKGSQCI